MIIRSLLCCAVFVAFATPAWGADKPPPEKVVKAALQKPELRTATKAPAKSTSRPTAKVTSGPTAKPAPAPTRVVLGRTETLTCRLGTEDRHARIGVVLIGDKVDSFAYYSKWKPRTCSIHLQRNRDHTSKWIDQGRVTNISVEKGLFLIEHGTGEYKFVFRDVDRERYCGMDGAINGTLTIRKGSEACQLTGIMDEGTPLGQAYAQASAQAPSTAAATPPLVPAEAPPPPRQVVQRSRPESDSPFPTSFSSVSD